MSKIELRVMQSSLVVNDDDMYVEGLVNKTESWSHTLGKRKKFKEKIAKGAFSKAIQSAVRIDFLAEHDTSKVLSTTENESLELWEDEEGLKMKAKICPTSYGKDIYELMKHNIVSHMSFGFAPISDKWKKLSNGTFERCIEALELKEVSVVRNPAYPVSAIAARGIELVEDVEIPTEVDNNTQRSLQMDNSNKKNIEQRAYATHLYNRKDVINSAMNIVADCSSLSGYLMRYVGEDKDTADVLISLQHAITMANKIINDEIQIVVDNFNEVDQLIKQEKEAQELIEASNNESDKDVEEVRAKDKKESKDDSSEEKKDDSSDDDEKLKDDPSKDDSSKGKTKKTSDDKDDKEESDDAEDDKKDKEKKDDEKRSLDLSSYRQRIKERII